MRRGKKSGGETGGGLDRGREDARRCRKICFTRVHLKAEKTPECMTRVRNFVGSVEKLRN